MRRFRRGWTTQQRRGVQQTAAAARQRYVQRSTGGRVRAVTPVKPHPKQGG